jgi:hypothetical protein
VNRREFLSRSAATGLGIAAGGRWIDVLGNRPLSVFGPFPARARPGPGPAEWLSHRPMHPLPVASNRPIDQRSRAFFLAPDGNDSRSGTSEGSAWRSFDRAAAGMVPGATLYLLGGHYWMADTSGWTRSGTRGAPVTIRAYPGQIAVLDYGYREFFDDPDRSWAPVPRGRGGIEGEYWSVRGGPADDGVFPLTPKQRDVAGNFGDSMIPLFRYRRLADLRSANERYFDGLQNNQANPTGLYCGPGAMWNVDTGRFHVRLAHTHIPELSEVDYLNHGPGFDHNYTGATDPRTLPLVLCSTTRPSFRGSHLRIQDVVVQGQDRLVVGDQEQGDVAVEVDGLHFFAGDVPIGILVGGVEAKLLNSKIRGFDAPWSSRFGDKNRTDHGILAQLAATRMEVAHNEFSDHHDGVNVTDKVGEIDIHHNRIENMNDDGLYLQPRHPSRIMRVYQNHFEGAVSYLPFRGGGQPGPTEPGAGVYVYRNFFDLRRGTYGGPPGGGRRNMFRRGLLTNEHSNAIRPDVFFYHNTIALQDRSEHNWYLANLGSDYAGATFRVYNNILILASTPPRPAVRPEAGTFESRGNLQWSLTNGSSEGRPGDVYGNPLLTAFGPDWREPTDVHLRAGSPAIDAGSPIPQEWPDPLRDLDAGAPDIGAIPYGVSGPTFGPGAGP